MSEPATRVAREIEDSIAVMRELTASCSSQILQAATLILACLRDGGKIFAFGNGGSAAEAQHFVAELVGRYRTDRRPLAAIALTAESASLTAIANDYGFDHIFSRQLEALAHAGDVAVAFSTSGNSPNIIRALESAKYLELSTVGLTGKTGGHLANLTDICLRAPSDSTPRIQEAHTLMTHIVCGLVEDAILAESGAKSQLKSAAGEVR
jgi:D-sedoheptulose 7-phosphate isomerase